MPNAARPLESPTPEQLTDPAEVIPLHQPVQAPLPEPSYVRLARRRAPYQRRSDLTDDDSKDHHSDQSDRDHRDGRARARATNALVARWLVEHLQYGEGQAAALVREHGARKVLDVIYDHVVKWQAWSNAAEVPGSYRLRPTDRWGRPIRNHAAYLTWHIKQG